MLSHKHYTAKCLTLVAIMGVKNTPAWFLAHNLVTNWSSDAKLGELVHR
jgi:hypothetical protein